jgi:hypothetical protein
MGNEMDRAYVYDLVWDKSPPLARELSNNKSSRDHSDFFTKAVSDMIKAGAASVLPSGVIPTVVSPLGDVTKSHSTKLRLVIAMRYVNEHLTKRVFKLEGLSNLSNICRKRATIRFLMI